MNSLLKAAALCLALTTSLLAADDIIVADFEGPNYGPWKVEGTAFGQGPAHGAIGRQMKVEGFLGKGLANSFEGGDNSTGLLTSPAFKLERKYLTFLIGGGGFAHETCLNLIVEGKVVRTATGPNTQPGGSETLAPASWDVMEFAGKEATLVIVDARQGGWGHINVDQIIQCDTAPPPPAVAITRKLRIDHDFLQLPMMNRQQKQEPGVAMFSIELDGKLVRSVHLKLAAKGQTPDTWYSYDVRAFRGREVTFAFKSSDADVLQRLELSDQELIDPKAYDGPLRPRFHFSPRLGWMNDINGSYYQDGLYHIFYQANPTTVAGGAGFDMHWGHSVSKDLVHWTEWPIALFPDAAGQCYSGTAVMAQQAIPGLTAHPKLPAPVLFMAATAPFSQHVATTADGGRTWQRFAGNPVVPNIGQGDRDPKVIWHEASQHYVMVLYVGGKGYLFLRSPDLIKWEQVSSQPNWFECPEFIPFKSPTTGEELWLLYGAYRSPKELKAGFNDTRAYQLGRFDGRTFTPVTEPRRAHQGPNFYAAITFSGQPQQRPIMMGWCAGTSFPGEPFNQCASLPLELSLKAFAGQDTLCFAPAAEVNALRGEPLLKLTNLTAAEATAQLATLAKDAPVDITLRFSAQAPVKLDAREFTLSFDPSTNTLKRGGQKTVLHPQTSIEARFLIDIGLIESFWNGGEAAYAAASLPSHKGPAFSIEGRAMIEELVVYPMKNIWK